MPRGIAWTEFRAYDVRYDCVMARLVMFDEQHQGHWTMIDGSSKGYRDRRDDALERLTKHIVAGEPAGELL